MICNEIKLLIKLFTNIRVNVCVHTYKNCVHLHNTYITCAKENENIILQFCHFYLQWSAENKLLKGFHHLHKVYQPVHQ